MASTATQTSVTGVTSDPGVSHPYTCNTCQVAFHSGDLQKGHMRGDWHRYNLKRRVASLPAISSEIFNEKVLQARASTSAEADKANFQKACDLCQKHFSSENSFRNHLGSAKHRARASAAMSKSKAGPKTDETGSMIGSTLSLGDSAATDTNSTVAAPSDAGDGFSDIVEDLKNAALQEEGPSPPPSNTPPHVEAASSSSDAAMSEAASGNASPAPRYGLKSCLFCNYESPTPMLNVVHMERIHGMFLPEKKYLADLDGLLGALQQRVYDMHQCLVCAKTKANVYAVQTHMRDKGHCLIPFTTEDEQLEIGDFYDFTSTYSDADDDYDDDDDDEEDMPPSSARPSAGSKLGARRSVQFTQEGNEEGEDNKGWETDSSASSLVTADLHAVPADFHYHQYERLNRHPHHSHDDPRAHHQRDGWHARNHKHARAVFYDDYELQLPSGRTIGHRSLAPYYRQNLYGHPSAEGHKAQRLAADHERLVICESRLARGLVTNRELNGMGLHEPTRVLAKKIARGRKMEFMGLEGKENKMSKKLSKAPSRHPATYLR